MPRIIINGAAAFGKFGTEASKGTKVFALAGKIKKGGLVEVPMGMTLKEVLFVIGGGKVGVRLYSALAFGIATFTLCLNPVQNFFFTAAFLASGVVAYIIFKKIYGGLTVENPVAYPQDPRTGLAVGDTRRIGLFALIIAGLFVLNLLINLLFLG